MPVNVLVASTGRSGTGYMSSILKRSGYRCGHEGAVPIREDMNFNYCLTSMIQTEYNAESSWLVVPHLSEFYSHMPQMKVIHLARNPFNVIKSFVDIGLFENSSSVYLKHILRSISSKNKYAFWAKYYITWHSHIEVWPGSKLFQNFESLDYGAISSFVEKEVSPLDCIVNSKSRQKRIDVPIDQVIDEISKTKQFDNLKKYCDKFGYEY